MIPCQLIIIISGLINQIYGLQCLHLYVDDVRAPVDQVPVTMRSRARRTLVEVPQPTLISYHVVSKVTARYVSTSAVATLVNNADVTQQAAFTFQMTPDAFINGFSMIVDGVAYVAQIKQREAAEDAYNQAISRGRNAAHVTQESMLSARFRVDLNLREGTEVSFNLTYQEMLQREKGRFTHLLYLSPGQVTDLLADVTIVEPQGLSLVESSWNPSENGLQPSVIFDSPSTRASVTFNPSKLQQSRLSGGKGVDWVLSVTYDVIHSLDGGDLQISNGYFVHHISPEGLPPAPKKIVFLIDVSASMYGPKMAQTVAAIVTILEELREIDKFNILTYSTEVEHWKEEAVPATFENKKAGQKFVTCIQAQSATDLQKGLIAAVNQFDVTDDAFPGIVLLSDGRPNAGVTDPNVIISTVAEASGSRVALFTLGIGKDVDSLLLRELASSNQGLYREVYVDSSAAIQISGFFGEVATPLLYNVAIRYQNGSVDEASLTENEFISYLDGSELVVTGRLADEYQGDSMGAMVIGRGLQEDVELNITRPIEEVVTPDMVEDFAERMWAYLTIKSLLTRARRDNLITSEPANRDQLNAKAFELSLRYSFVTPLASILVLRPPEVLPMEQIPPTTTRDPPLVTPHRITPSSSRPEPQPKQDITGTAPAQVSPPISLVGGDPHFIVQIPHTNLTICYDIQAKNGTILNLISDPELGIYVNAEVVPVNKTQTLTDAGHSPSLLGSLGVRLGYYKLHITSDMVLIDSEIIMTWGIPRSIIISDYNITIHNKANMSISIRDTIDMRITLHNHWSQHPDHFDFFVLTDGGFSPKVHGLLGQFQYKPIHLINPRQGLSANGHIRAIMNINGQKKFVFKMVEVLDISYDCWWAPAEVYIDGTVDQYYVQDIHSHFTEAVG